MKNKSITWVFGALILLSVGCARLTEVSKAVWGSSTKALEESRVDALGRTYQCGYDNCFEEVLKIAKDNHWTVFINEKKRSRIVLMGIPDSISTTEVGVFFLVFGPQETKLEVASLSPQAKRTAAEIIFTGISKAYEEISGK